MFLVPEYLKNLIKISLAVGGIVLILHMGEILLAYSCESFRNSKSINTWNSRLRYFETADACSIMTDLSTATNDDNKRPQEKCNSSWAVKLSEKSRDSKINEKDVFILFKTIDTKCESNTEYSQIINESIWVCLKNNIKAFSFAYSGKLSAEKRVFILKAIENPVHDKLILNLGMREIEEKLQCSKKHKKELLNSIGVAQKKRSIIEDK